jgi:hypothetical protein
MSHFVECRTEFRDQRALVAALVECRFEPSQIEIHDKRPGDVGQTALADA